MITRLTRHTYQRTAMMLAVMLMTMTALAQTVSFPTESGGTGTVDDPYKITTADDLNKLAADVNSGTAYSGTYFQLGADLAYDHTTAWDDTTSIENNYTPIGYYNGYSTAWNRPFRGHFDGKGHTISGIRIYTSGSDVATDSDKGIFGYITKDAVVTGITLDDARIVGYSRVGGIVGYNDGDHYYEGTAKGGTISYCTVTDHVAIHIIQQHYYFGGIVGYNTGGTITYCVSSVQMTAATGIIPRYCGGIAGACDMLDNAYYDGITLSDNLVVGAVIPYAVIPYGTNSSLLNAYGAISSEHTSSNSGRVAYARNYYYGCTVAGVENATGVGVAQNTTKTLNLTDITKDDGAVPTYLLALAEGISATPAPAITFDGKPYYKKDTTITLTGMPTDTPPVGYIYEGYIVNDEVISDSAFTMPAQNTTVTSATVPVYPLILEDGISATTAPAITFDGTPYYKEGTTITLYGQPDAENGYIKPYTVNDSIIYGDKFVMPAVNVTVGLGALTDDWQRVYAGTVADPYKIYTTAQLDLLAQRVNSGAYSYEGKYFLLMNDLCYEHTSAWNDTTSTENNYTAIGCSYFDGTNHDYRFCGHFLGDGHTISGIRIYKNDDCQGLFGVLGKGAEVSGVTLTDTRISAANGIGGIVGYNYYGSVTDCHVASDVMLLCLNSYAENLGGIVGFNSNGTITNCTSAVTIMLTSNVSSGDCFGSIVGNNIKGTITNCRAIGAIVPAVTDAGAVVGYNSSGTTVSNNTYHSCLVGTNAFNIGTGYYNADGIRFIGGFDLSGKAELDNTALHLFDNRDNTALIDAYANPSEHTANDGSAPDVSNIAITLRGRTLYKDGSWNTICLPFDVNIAGSVLNGAVARPLSTASITGDETTGQTLHLTFGDAVTELQAGVPYIIKWAEGDNITDPVFTNMHISPTEPTTVTSQDGMVSFIGTYGTVSLAANDKSNIYFGSANKLLWPDQNVTVGAFRAYFKINETAAVNAKGITGFVIDFGENDEEATAIHNAEFIMQNDDADAWYTVDGIRLNGKPSKRGMYIHNGKKVVVE